MLLIAEQMRQAKVVPLGIVLEPMGRNTAPAAATAALMVAGIDPQALILLMPADHIIQNRAGFLNAVDKAARAAEQGHLVTFGIVPHRAVRRVQQLHTFEPSSCFQSEEDLRVEI